MTIKIDQIADAIISKPGIAIDVLDFTPSATISTASTTFEEAVQTSFYTEVAGAFVFTTNIDTTITGVGTARVHYRLVIDKSTVNEIAIAPNDGYWSQIHSSQSIHRQASFISPPTEIDIGSHTITLEWKVVGSFTVSMVADDSFCHITAVSTGASGAGGVLEDSISLTTDQTGIAGSWTDIDDGVNKLELTFDTAENETVLAVLRATGTLSTASAAWSRLLLDMVQVDESVSANESSGGMNIDIVIPLVGLSAGSHTVKAQAYASTGTLTIEGDSTRGLSSLYIIRFRGGLVPIQQDGYNIVGQPRAFNFVGANINAVDNYGVADISISEVLSLPEQVSDPLYEEGYGKLYTKDVDGYAELHYLDNYGLITQVTRKGNINGLQEDTQPLSPSIYDDEFDGYESLNPRWTWVGGGAPSDVGENWQIKNSRLSLTLTGNDSGFDPSTAHLLEQDIPSLAINWVAVTKVRANPRVNYNRFGIYVNHDENNWLQYVFGWDGGKKIWTDYRVGGTWSFSQGSETINLIATTQPMVVLLALQHDLTSNEFHSYYSWDGNEWLQSSISFDYTLWSGLPTKIGLVSNPTTATSGVVNQCSWEWFRVLPELP